VLVGLEASGCNSPTTCACSAATIIKTIVDYGSGKGKLKRALDELKLGLEIQNYDPCVPGDDTLPSQADLVVCFDVLEHVEPDLLENVLAHIRDLARKCVMLSISNIPSSRTLGDGRNAHLIIEDDPWWQARLARFFHIIKSQNIKDGNGELIGSHFYLAVPIPQEAS